MNDRSSIRIGILTISDRASRGIYSDRSGPAIVEALRDYLRSEWESVCRVIPDERDAIERELIRMTDAEGCCLVLTTGGTGPAARDVTPEATEVICHKILPGFGEEMRRVSLQYVPTAILSRQVAGVRGASLIINLPGKPKSIRECLDAVFPAVPYAIDLIGGPRLECHENVMKIFRPET